MMIMNTNTNTIESPGFGRIQTQAPSRNQSQLQTGAPSTEDQNRPSFAKATEGALRAETRVSMQPRCPVGVMEGRLCGWVDLGTQRNRFGSPAAGAGAGKDKGLRRVMLTFCVRGSAGETWRVSREFTLSGGPRSALRALLEAWRGQPYASDEEAWQAVRQPLRVLERPGLVRISERAGKDGRMWPQVEGVWPMLKGAQALPLRWPPVYFTLDAPCRETFQGLLPWVQAKVRASEEWGRLERGEGKVK